MDENVQVICSIYRTVKNLSELNIFYELDVDWTESGL